MTHLITTNTTMVTKAMLITLLDTSAMSFAMFMASGSQEGLAIRILFENVDELDLGGTVVQSYLLPLLLAAGAVDQAAVDRVNGYLAESRGLA